MAPSKKGQPSVDPYDALGITPGAPDAEITKAYRKLALKLHPDKHKSDLSPKEVEEAAHRFQQIQEARSFLLDAEHQEDRRKYDAKRESERLRKQADELRERTMSAKRKRMRDDLKEKEAMAREQSRKKLSSRRQKRDQELVDSLRRDGKKMREAYAERDAQKEMERELKRDRKSRKEVLEDRQVRLKWDRKKISISPSEHSIASLLSKFGTVETVEFLGSKGNQALITFAEASSCRPCVEAYATSKEMRAKFVGKRKEGEYEREKMEQDTGFRKAGGSTTTGRDGESLAERRLRQAAEREALLRQMEHDEEDGSLQDNQADPKPAKKKVNPGTSNTSFPLPFPDTDELRNLSPLEKLEVMEQKILGGLLSQESLLSMRITQTR